MEPGQATEAVFVAIAGVMTTAVSRGEWDKASICLEMLRAIERARGEHAAARKRQRAASTGALRA